LSSLQAVLCAGVLLLATAAPARTLRHVVVVGVNTSMDAGTPALSFADDDAVRYAEVLAPQAASLQLLTVLDPELQRAFPDLAARAVAPTRKALSAALSTTFAQIEADRRAGDDADFIFVFAGHGGVSQQGEGYVSLADARLTRTEMFAEVVGPSPARFNHIVVDACSAYLLLHRGSASAAVRGFLQSADLERHANTGALLATSRDQATHEWSRLRGGVFSHQLLSALAGAADVDNNSELTYAEVGAFVDAANAGVRDQRARVDVSVSPPRALLTRPLWQLSDDVASLATHHVNFTVPQSTTGRVSVLDARGDVRVDLNKSNEQRLDLRLAGAAPFIVRLDGVEQTLVRDERGWQLVRSCDALDSRGSLDEALQRGLYAVPFGRGYVAGYASQLERLASTSSTASTSTPFPVVSTAIVSGAAVFGVGAVVSGAYAVHEFAALNDGAGNLTAFAAQDIANRINIATAVSIGLLAASGVATAAAVWSWPNGEAP
jgi:hypothetical protein